MAKNILYLKRNPSHFKATPIRYDLKLSCKLALSFQKTLSDFSSKILHEFQIFHIQSMSILLPTRTYKKILDQEVYSCVIFSNLASVVLN